MDNPSPLDLLSGTGNAKVVVTLPIDILEVNVDDQEEAALKQGMLTILSSYHTISSRLILGLHKFIVMNRLGCFGRGCSPCTSNFASHH